MKQYRVAILRKEFSFIDKLMDGVSPEMVSDIKIRKGDQGLLGKKGGEDSYSWSGGGHYDYTKYFAVHTSDEGEQILEIASAGNSGTGSGDRNSWEADTIGEQLFVKGIVPDYIVECVKNDTDDNGNGEVTRFWTIYKMKRFDLSSYHQQKLDEAATALKAEIAATCA